MSMTLRETAVDACSRKVHAVTKGYFHDRYLAAFNADTTYINSPLMNRGYWLRVKAVEATVNRFVESLADGEDFQVVSIGSGYDTLFFRWAEGSQCKAECPNDQFSISPQSAAGRAMADGRLKKFVEIDLPDVITGKDQVIKHREVLQEIIAGCGDGKVYRTIASDITDVKQLTADLRAELDPKRATLIICECVLVYIDARHSTAMLKSFTDGSVFDNEANKNIMFFGYDAINPTSPFGKQMVHSLAERGVPLKGIHDLPSPQAHVDRAKACGFENVRSVTMKTLFGTVPVEAQKRLNALEQIDDYDEWCLVHEHYGITVGAVNPAANVNKIFVPPQPAA